jgi:hypothetical protein
VLVNIKRYSLGNDRFHGAALHTVRYRSAENVTPKLGPKLAQKGVVRWLWRFKRPYHPAAQ